MPPQEASTMELLSDTAKSQVQNTGVDYSFALQEPSSVAFATILVSLNHLDPSGIFVNQSDKNQWMQSVLAVAGLKVEGLMSASCGTETLPTSSSAKCISELFL
jgi:hypothetical protein